MKNDIKIDVMKEDFLYYLWEHRLLKGALKTHDGLPVRVVNPGFRNLDSGPDYLEAKIEIGEQLWAGQVEIHVRTSDWNRHGHQYDKAYNNVVLHVVYEDDVRVNAIPTLALKGHFDEWLYQNYERFVGVQHWIACERSISEVQPFALHVWLERMAVERMERKTEAVAMLLKANHYDWEDALYRLLLRYSGMKVNSEACEYLASILPLKTLMKHADNPIQVEAMLMGCAGFLSDDEEEEYVKLLQREFAVMRAKFGLLVMPKERWKFLRMRPMNFITVRLAQMAQLIHRNGAMFATIREAETIAQVLELFEVTASSYWDTHYRFEVSSEKQPKHLGRGTADVLIINAIVPLLFCYGKLHKEERYCEKAMRFLESLDAEDNAIIRHYAYYGVKAQNALQTQALLHLYGTYCKRKRCLECSIGTKLIPRPGG